MNEIEKIVQSTMDAMVIGFSLGALFVAGVLIYILFHTIPKDKE